MLMGLSGIGTLLVSCIALRPSKVKFKMKAWVSTKDQLMIKVENNSNKDLFVERIHLAYFEKRHFFSKKRPCKTHTIDSDSKITINHNDIEKGKSKSRFYFPAKQTIEIVVPASQIFTMISQFPNLTDQEFFEDFGIGITLYDTYYLLLPKRFINKILNRLKEL